MYWNWNILRGDAVFHKHFKKNEVKVWKYGIKVFWHTQEKKSVFLFCDWTAIQDGEMLQLCKLLKR